LPDNAQYSANPEAILLIIVDVRLNNSGVYKCQYEENDGLIVMDTAMVLVLGKTSLVIIQ